MTDHLRSQWREAAGGGVHYLILPKHPVLAHAALTVHARSHKTGAQLDDAWSRSLLHQITVDDGFTIHDHVGDSPTTGFMVSVDKSTEKVYPLSEVVSNPEIIADYYRTHQSSLENPDTYFGAWVQDGQVFFDVSKHVTDQSEANALGWNAQQEAFYDIGNGRSIFCVPPNQFTGKVVLARNATHWRDQVEALVAEESS